jgi:gas vesicle protein
MENTNENGKLIGALLLGAAIGGTLGILFAPDKGIETRKKLSVKGEHLTDALKDKFNELLEEAKDEVKLVKEKANTFMKNGTDKDAKVNKSV